MKKQLDKGVVGEILRPHLSGLKGENWEVTFDNPKNIFLTEGSNLALFEEDSKDVYYGHYFFNTFRGKTALLKARQAIEEVFSMGGKVIKGLTPVDNKPAKLMSRWLGFSSYGIIETHGGPMELFILTKKDTEYE